MYIFVVRFDPMEDVKAVYSSDIKIAESEKPAAGSENSASLE